MCVFLILMIYSTEFRPIVFVRTQITCVIIQWKFVGGAYLY